MTIQFIADSAKLAALSDKVEPSGKTKAQSAFERPQDLEERLWQEFATRAESADPYAARVLLMGFEGEPLVETRKMVRAASLAYCASCKDVDQLRDIADMSGAFSHIVVNFDAFETSSEAVDALFRFRMKQRQIVVLVVSASVNNDDLSAERQSICDTTLRAPFSPGRLYRGLVAASMNKANCWGGTVMVHAGDS
jgi:hypothetical protein